MWLCHAEELGLKNETATWFIGSGDGRHVESRSQASFDLIKGSGGVYFDIWSVGLARIRVETMGRYEKM